MTTPAGPYTPMVQAGGGWIVVSGQIGLAGGRLADGFEAQLVQALANLREQLESVGATMADVVKTTVFLRHMADYARMNELYIAAFGDPNADRDGNTNRYVNSDTDSYASTHGNRKAERDGNGYTDAGAF